MLYCAAAFHNLEVVATQATCVLNFISICWDLFELLPPALTLHALPFPVCIIAGAEQSSLTPC